MPHVPDNNTNTHVVCACRVPCHEGHGSRAARPQHHYTVVEHTYTAAVSRPSTCHTRMMEGGAVASHRARHVCSPSRRSVVRRTTTAPRVRQPDGIGNALLESRTRWRTRLAQVDLRGERLEVAPHLSTDQFTLCTCHVAGAVQGCRVMGSLCSLRRLVWRHRLPIGRSVLVRRRRKKNLSLMGGPIVVRRRSRRMWLLLTIVAGV